MPKKIDDIVPNSRRSIRDIPIPTRRVAPTVEPETPTQAPTYSPPTRLNYSIPKRERPKTWLFAGIVIFVFGCGLAFISLRNGAVVTYKPKVFSVAFANEVVTASNVATTSALSYSTIKVSKEKSVDVPASGEETVSERARGTIVVYNTQTSKQDLVKSTRFETSSAKIYRIEKDISVPAQGSLEVEVVADKAGESENIGLTDFTLPGLKGTARFDKVYARSKTPMTGGFIGIRKKVEASELVKAKASLENLLREEMLSEIVSQVPQDFAMFPNLVITSYEVLPTTSAGESLAKVTVRGNLSSIVFKRQDLAQYLAVQKLGAKNVGSPVDLPDLSKLNASLAGSGIESASSTIKINFVGSADIVAVTDKKALAVSLLGKREEELPKILESYPSIAEASAVVRPFWKSTFPTEETKIKIEERK